MSLDAMVWAMHDADTDGPLERLVLVYVANGAPPDGRVATMDWHRFAALAGVTPVAVRRAADRMIARGLIREIPGFGWHLAAPVEPEPSAPTGRSISRADRHAIYERDGHQCLRCGDGDLSIDHVFPVSLGGASHRDNYQTLCRACNSWKGARTGAEFDYRTEVSA